MKSIIRYTAPAVVLCLAVSCASYAVRQYQGKEFGPIANRRVALEVAGTIFEQCYGKIVLDEGPFTVLSGEHAGLQVWIVTAEHPARTAGGIPRLEITKEDGRVLVLSRSR